MADSPTVDAGAGTSAGAGADSGGAAGQEASVTCARVRAYTLNVSMKVRSSLCFARRLFYRLARRLLPP